VLGLDAACVLPSHYQQQGADRAGAS
jgi:hypothetical protein